MTRRAIRDGQWISGIGAIGVFCIGAALLSSVIVLAFVREEPIDLEMTAA